MTMTSNQHPSATAKVESLTFYRRAGRFEATRYESRVGESDAIALYQTVADRISSSGVSIPAEDAIAQLEESQRKEATVGRVVVRSEVLDHDLHLISNTALKDALRKLGRDPEAGKPLAGGLRGCRSIRVEGENRLVYRIEAGVVEVLAIGRRRDSEAYNTATGRI